MMWLDILGFVTVVGQSALRSVASCVLCVCVCAESLAQWRCDFLKRERNCAIAQCNSNCYRSLFPILANLAYNSNSCVNGPRVRWCVVVIVVHLDFWRGGRHMPGVLLSPFIVVFSLFHCEDGNKFSSILLQNCVRWFVQLLLGIWAFAGVGDTCFTFRLLFSFLPECSFSSFS